jgi:hypothetical protein
MVDLRPTRTLGVKNAPMPVKGILLSVADPHNWRSKLLPIRLHHFKGWLIGCEQIEVFGDAE